MIQKSECRDNYAKENRILWIDNLRGGEYPKVCVNLQTDVR